MLRFRFLVSIFIFLANIYFTHTHKHSDKPLLLIVSFDGFRWDYLSKYNLKNFNLLRKNSSYADFIYNQFVTATFPNHFSIITGLNEESHGIIQNSMFDRVLNKTFDTILNDPKSLTDWFGQNPLAMPVWTLNQKAGDGRRSASNWIGSNAKLNGIDIMNIPFNQSASFKGLVDQFIGLFVTPIDPINFGALYFYEPDYTGHLYGPDSNEMKTKLEEIDDILGYLISQLQSHHLYNKLNLIITSDHGMESISENTAIYLKDHIDLALIDGYGSPACYNLFSKKQSDIDIIYNRLKKLENIDVFKKEQIPDSLHYKSNVRIGDIVLVAKLGYSIWKEKNPNTNWKTTNGMHGYYNNNTSMYPIFMAHGPAFKVDYKIHSFNTVDLYPLMCLLLGLTPGYNHGSIKNVFDMVIYKEVDVRGKELLMLGLIPVGIAAASILAFCFYCHCKKSQNKSGYQASYSMLTTNEMNLGSVYEIDENSNDDNLLFSKNGTNRS